MHIYDALAIDVFGSTGILWPSDGQGGAVGIAAATPTSAAATSTYTATTATDSAFNTTTAIATAGCLVTTSTGYYARVRSFTAGLGGVLTVNRWLHKDPALVGGVPASGVATFTLWTNPIVGTNRTCIIADALEVVVESVTFNAITGAGNLQLRDAAGNALLPSNGYVFAAAAVPSTVFNGMNGRRHCGIVGFQASSAATVNASAILRVLKHDSRSSR